jgi:putative MATE family efflux protein
VDCSLGDVARLAWPIVSQQLLRTCAFAFATYTVGRLGPEGTAAMGIAMPISLTITALLTALAVAATATVARASGSGDRRARDTEAASALVFGGIVGLVLAPIGVVFLPGIAAFFSVADSPHVAAMVRSYLFFEGVALGFAALDAAATGALRGMGRPDISLGAAITSNAILLPLSWLLVLGAPAVGIAPMGLRGAGVAYALACAVQATLSAGALLLRGSPVQISLSAFRRVGRSSLGRLAGLAAPGVVEPALIRSGHLAFAKAITLLGAADLAAHQAALSLEAFTSFSGLGFGVAASALVGQRLGANRPQSAEQAIRITTRIAVRSLLAFGIGLLIFASPLTHIFLPAGASAATSRAAITCMLFVAIEQPFMGSAMVFAGALRGAGDTRTPVFAVLGGMWLVRIPLTWFLLFHLRLGLAGAWIGMLGDWVFRAAAFRMALARGKWRTVRL